MSQSEKPRDWVEQYANDCVQSYTTDDEPIWLRLREFIAAYDSQAARIAELKKENAQMFLHIDGIEKANDNCQTKIAELEAENKRLFNEVLDKHTDNDWYQLSRELEMKLDDEKDAHFLMRKERDQLAEKLRVAEQLEAQNAINHAAATNGQRRIAELEQINQHANMISSVLKVERDQLAEKLRVAEEALDSIASWKEGAEVSRSFDEPSSARKARQALAKVRGEG